VKTSHKNILATVFRKPGRSFVALGSWAGEDVQVNLAIDWKSLGLDPERTMIRAPAIPGIQPQQTWKPNETISVAPKKGWFLVLKEEK
jgi:hypothetical protein